MILKIVFYIWAFITIYNLGEICYVNIRLKRQFDNNNLSETHVFEKLWNAIRTIVLCALPLIHVISFFYYVFNMEKFYNKCKASVEEKIKTHKEN